MAKGIAGVVGVLFALLLVGSCMRDYATAVPRVEEVLILDKGHVPGHYDTHCSSDDKGHTSCSTTWVPPSWTVEYADAQRWTTSVSQGTWDSLSIGEKKVLRFDEGGGFWGARYNERFSFGPIIAEGSLPTRWGVMPLTPIPGPTFR